MKRDYSKEALIQKWANVKTPAECWPFRLRSFVFSKAERIKYGLVTLRGKRMRAHRVVAQLWGMNIDGNCVCHSCDNPLCLNPSHLFIGSHAENMKDKMSKGRHRVNPKYKLPNDVASIVAERARAGENQRELAVEFGISQPMVSNLKNGKGKRAIYAHQHDWAGTTTGV